MTKEIESAESIASEIDDAQEKEPLVSISYSGEDKSYSYWRGRKLRATKITGLKITDGSVTDKYAFTLPYDEAQNLQEFYNGHIAHPKSGERYNCNYFGYSVKGWSGAKPSNNRIGGLARAIITGKVNMAYKSSQLLAVGDNDSLEAGRLYGIGSPDNIYHTFVGIGGRATLSVLGAGYNPDLVIADGPELAMYYGGNVYEILSPSNIPSSTYMPSQI
jgi:hypothetical protein